MVLYVALMLGMIESLKLRYENIDSDELLNLVENAIDEYIK